MVNTSHFTVADNTNSHYQTPTNTYNFVNRQSNELLVTIGDSWTWGNDLEDRLKSVYGELVSDHFNCDWLNLSLPGTGNFFITHLAEQLGTIELNYDKVRVICTFTEIGRSTNSQDDIDFDYNNWYLQNFTEYKDLYKLLYSMNRSCVNRIVTALPDYQVVFGSNMVEPLGFEDKNHIEKSWTQLMSEKQGFAYSDYCYGIGHGISHLERIKNLIPITDTDYKKWMVELLDGATKRIDVVSNSNFFKNLHPLKHGHRIWADACIKVLNNT
tara:strand:- start:128 stop:937 length:810 start_codon:yes stop_codon:yes gene_type:complete